MKHTAAASAGTTEASVETASRLFQRYHTYSRRRVCEARGAQNAAKSWRRSLRSWLPADRSAPILDIGCGEGVFLSFLKAQGYANLEGFDLSGENVEICRARGLGFVKQFDALHLADWPQQRRYGAIFALDLVEHLPKQAAAGFLEQARRLLAPGGSLVLQTPNMGNLWACWHLHYCLSHEWGLTEKTATTLLLLAGFPAENVEVRPCWSATTLAGRLRETYSRLIHRLLWLTEHSGRPTIPTQNLLIRAVRP